MYFYYQRLEHDAWFLLSCQANQGPAKLAKAQGAKKLTILELNQIVSDGSDPRGTLFREIRALCRHGRRPVDALPVAANVAAQGCRQQPVGLGRQGCKCQL